MINDVLMGGYILTVIVALGIMTYYFVVRMIGFFDPKNVAPDIKISQSQATPFSPSVQEDTRDAATKKRVQMSIQDQWQSLNARALKRHCFECPDPWTCTKNPCFIPVGDKIVGTSTVTRTRGVTKAEKEILRRNKE